jgi:hypothetical protein
MPERERYIAGVPCWVDTAQPDPAAAVEFYGGLFGWTLEDAMPDEEAHYFMGTIRGGAVAGVGSVPEGAPAVATWNTYVAVDSADVAARRARDAGGDALEPFDVMDAGRMAVLTDVEGATLCVWEAKASPGAQIVNEHGSVNFNTLATRDMDGAQSFYGTLFGWRVLSIPAGPMWILPGYGDHLEEDTPGLRDQMAQMGAPDGFVDVVAAVGPIPDGDAETLASWSVTFAVDDVDGIAEAAKGLGGQVLEGPTDVPWSRQATIEDPQGATFIASQFVADNKDIEA